MAKFRGPEGEPVLPFEPNLEKPHPKPNPDSRPVKSPAKKNRRPEDYDPTDVGVSAPVEKR